MLSFVIGFDNPKHRTIVNAKLRQNYHLRKFRYDYSIAIIIIYAKQKAYPCEYASKL